ncbi:MAG: phosphoglycerate dehydrogenase [Acidobacteria bacterium]|nr:MAG: phosphoglycerate dehydrogenase [Acidobacteriota bacterium]
MRALLLENVHPEVDVALQQFGEVEIHRLDGTPTREELHRRIADVELLGIRSRTQVDRQLLERAERLRAVGCFCIGTNQVDLEFAAERGVAVFNAPFANTRSVAELTLASVVMLMRGIPQKMQAIRRGRWLKSAAGAHEVRGKKLGSVGYGNIGSQLSVLASGHGMHVYYHDIEPKLAHGNARVVGSLEELLADVDVVTLHVPSNERTRGMIDAAALARMRSGAFLINHARGDLVDIDALVEALRSGHLAGAAVDVFPREPKSSDEGFESPLTEFDNVLLTPHIGGSTIEAQAAIGRDAAFKLARYHFEGATTHAVNFPQVEPGVRAPGSHRLLCLHRNAPGFLSRLNETVSGAGGNVVSQHLQTRGQLGYAVSDIEGRLDQQLLRRVRQLEGTVRARLLAP